jgi:DNA-binding winged helix-turn-helix (wHTH) protein
MQRKHFYDFGPYRVDTVKRLLLKEGEPVALTPKAFDTLLVLVESSGQVLPKEEMMKQVWPDRFVEEGNLTVNISLLRKVLGETPNQHDYIVTVPGSGYRFVAHVREILADGAELTIEEHTSARVTIEQEEVKEEKEILNRETLWPDNLYTFLAAVRGLKLHWKVLTSLFLLLGLIAFVITWKYSFRTRAQYGSVLLSSLKTVQLSNWASEPGEFASDGKFSPDGNMAAFSSKKDGYSSIWIRQIVGGEPIQVTKNEWNNWSPIWSSDGQRIAFLSSTGNDTSISSIPAFGNTPTLLLTLEACKPTLIRWSKDDATIYYELNSNIFALDVATKQTTQKTHFTPNGTYPEISAYMQEKTRSPTLIIKRVKSIFGWPQ